MVTSMVLGDDVVSRFGLATATDLRSGSSMIKKCKLMLLTNAVHAHNAKKNFLKNLTTIYTLKLILFLKEIYLFVTLNDISTLP
jgi:hypothetical protein